jgi:hypothetical protein
MFSSVLRPGRRVVLVVTNVEGSESGSVLVEGLVVKADELLYFFV